MNSITQPVSYSYLYPLFLLAITCFQHWAARAQSLSPYTEPKLQFST